jgi:hypothetical protein
MVMTASQMPSVGPWRLRLVSTAFWEDLSPPQLASCVARVMMLQVLLLYHVQQQQMLWVQAAPPAPPVPRLPAWWQFLPLLSKSRGHAVQQVNRARCSQQEQDAAAAAAAEAVGTI